jgi:hypothetical protein
MNARQLLFVISQPRAGSTLLQRMLGQHPAVFTTSEPWLLLHGAYSLRATGVSAEYNHGLFASALTSFLDDNCGGRGAYVEALRRMYLHLYGEALHRSGKTYFLDKTPRYHLIVPEIRELFPDATIVCLLRNPLAVLASIVSTWTGPGAGSLSHYRTDLLSAPRNLAALAASAGKGTIVVRYERLVSDPLPELEKVLTPLGLHAVAGLANLSDIEERWKLGDQGHVYAATGPLRERADGWTAVAADPRVWRMMSEYAEALGPELLGCLGYSLDDVRITLDAVRPPLWRRRLSVSFADAITGTTRNGWLHLLKRKTRSILVARVPKPSVEWHKDALPVSR